MIVVLALEVFFAIKQSLNRDLHEAVSQNDITGMFCFLELLTFNRV